MALVDCRADNALAQVCLTNSSRADSTDAIGRRQAIATIGAFWASAAAIHIGFAPVPDTIRARRRLALACGADAALTVAAPSTVL